MTLTARVSPVSDAGLPSLRGVKVLVVDDDETTRWGRGLDVREDAPDEISALVVVRDGVLFHGPSSAAFPEAGSVEFLECTGPGSPSDSSWRSSAPSLSS